MSKCHMADRRINGIAMYVCMYERSYVYEWINVTDNFK